MPEDGKMNTFQKYVALWNKAFFVIMKVPVLDKLLGQSMGVLAYTGCKSGKKISLSVAFT